MPTIRNNIKTVLLLLLLAGSSFAQTIVGVGHGGTGQSSLTIHTLLIGNGTSGLTMLANVAAGRILTSVASSDPAWSATPTLGAASDVTGQLKFKGTTSGTVTLSVLDAAGTWTMKLPATGGTSGWFLQTDGSGNTTWAAASGGLSGLTANAAVYATSSSAITSPGAAMTDGQLLIGATGGAPAHAALTGTSNQVVVTNGTNSITLSTPQSIATSSNPQFATIGLGASNSAIPVLTAQTSATTNALVTQEQHSLSSSGTPAANFGQTFLYRLDDNTTANQNAAKQIFEWTTATHASHASQYRLQLSTGGAAVADVLTITGAGAGTFVGALAASNLSGTNTGDVTLAGETYLSISSQVITAASVNLSGTHVTGTLAAARFGTLTGDVTTAGGSYATTWAASTVLGNHYVVRETPSGTINGSNVTFTLASSPISGTEELFLNGQLMTNGSGKDYTISTVTVTFEAGLAPLTGDILRVTYWK